MPILNAIFNGILWQQLILILAYLNIWPNKEYYMPFLVDDGGEAAGGSAAAEERQRHSGNGTQTEEKNEKTENGKIQI